LKNQLLIIIEEVEFRIELKEIFVLCGEEGERGRGKEGGRGGGIICSTC
jgi:hypothetical protein